MSEFEWFDEWYGNLDIYHICMCGTIAGEQKAVDSQARVYFDILGSIDASLGHQLHLVVGRSKVFGNYFFFISHTQVT
jgi:hypothetical protein